MSSETTTEFPVGARVLVSADADDVWFGGEVEGVVIEDDEPIQDSYVGENRVLVRAQAEAASASASFCICSSVTAYSVVTSLMPPPLRLPRCRTRRL